MITKYYATIGDEEGVFVTPAGHQIVWGAIFAGFSLFIALSWLLLLLGAALGVGLADATDLAALGDGLGIGSIIWMLLTSLVATFCGAVLAAKLAGSPDNRIGGLHGLTVWAVSTMAVIVLGASGVGGTINAISGAISTGSDFSKSVIKVAGGEEGSGFELPEVVTSSAAAALKRQASRAISATATGEDQPNRREVRAAIESLSAEDSGAVISALLAGDTAAAQQQLRERTELSGSEINSIIKGAEGEIDSWRDSEAAEDAQAWLDEQVNNAKQSASAAISEMAGPQVSAREVKKALGELDAEVLTDTAQQLIMGNPEEAKDILAINTSLSESEIEAIVDGAQQEVQQKLDEAKVTINETTEAIGTYTQAMLWTAFIAGALGLVAGIVGGYTGAGTVRRIYGVRVA